MNEDEPLGYLRSGASTVNWPGIRIVHSIGRFLREFGLYIVGAIALLLILGFAAWYYGGAVGGW